MHHWTDVMPATSEYDHWHKAISLFMHNTLPVSSRTSLVYTSWLHVILRYHLVQQTLFSRSLAHRVKSILLGALDLSGIRLIELTSAWSCLATLAHHLADGFHHLFSMTSTCHHASKTMSYLEWNRFHNKDNKMNETKRLCRKRIKLSSAQKFHRDITRPLCTWNCVKGNKRNWDRVSEEARKKLRRKNQAKTSLIEIPWSPGKRASLKGVKRVFKKDTAAVSDNLPCIASAKRWCRGTLSFMFSAALTLGLTRHMSMQTACINHCSCCCLHVCVCVYLSRVVVCAASNVMILVRLYRACFYCF